MVDDVRAQSAMWPIEGQFPCGAGFLVTPDCLGNTFVSRTENYQCAVSMPELTVSAGRAGLRRPLWKFVLAGEDRGDYGSSDEWGSIACVRGETPIYAHVVRCVVHSEVPARDETQFKLVAAQFGDELAVWWKLVCDWLDVLTLQDFASLKRTQRSILNESVQIWSGDAAGVRRAGISYQVLTGGLHQVEILDKPQLQAAFDLAALGTQPDAEWLFVRDARSLVNAGEYRRAVIDACTATELAVTALIDRKFDDDGTGQSERTSEFGAHRGLSKLTQLHKKRHASGRLPKQLVKNVAAPRNRAAHRGETLCRHEAETAVEAAAEVVAIAFPLSSFVPGFPETLLSSSRHLGILPQNEDMHLASGCDLILKAAMSPVSGMQGQTAISVSGRAIRHEDTPPESSTTARPEV